MEDVYYPGLETHSNHEIAKRQMRGYGEVLSFFLEGDFDAIRRFVHLLRYTHIAANLGPVETAAGPPRTTSHVEVTAEQRAAMGIPESSIRYSVGRRCGRLGQAPDFCYNLIPMNKKCSTEKGSLITQTLKVLMRTFILLIQSHPWRNYFESPRTSPKPSGSLPRSFRGTKKGFQTDIEPDAADDAIPKGHSDGARIAPGSMYTASVRVSLTLVLAGLSLAGLLSSPLSPRAAQMTAPVNVAPQVWEATAGSEDVEFLVILAQQADLSAAATLPTREARLRYVYNTLRETARHSQASLRAQLDTAGVEYRPFYIVNMVAVKGDRALVKRLAARPEVARVAANPQVRIPPPAPQPGDLGPQTSQGIEWNVARINADDAWAMGYTGQSIVVAGQDTGYEWDHPALINRYRGYNGVTATHDYNWHDAIHTNNPNTAAGNPCGFDSPIPCDDNSHGTHTMGTIVGDDGAANQIGVAPGARWIGCRNMEEGWGTPTTYAECFEFFLAPYPIGGDPSTDGVPTLAPHVINNSWYCPPAEGCDQDTLKDIVENVRAAGIVVVVSAGNSGSGCSTVQHPPAIYDAAFSIGATDNGDDIASFSSRGPVTVDGSGRLKPDIAAPGVSVRSSLPGDRYGTKSGTSMAGPHVAGAVALLWSASPRLIGDVETTEHILTQSARPRVDTSCGGETAGVPNNVYGWGILDTLAAIQRAQPGLEVVKQASFSGGIPIRSIRYTINVTNTSDLTLTQIVLTDATPVSTTFAWASDAHTHAGGTVTWTSSSLAPQGTLAATLAVTVEHLPPGTQVINSAYGVRASELLTPVAGIPLEITIPWRYALLSIFKNRSSGADAYD